MRDIAPRLAKVRAVSDSYYGDFKNRRHDGVWQILNRVMVALIMFAFATIIVCACIPQLKNQRDQAEKVEQLKSDIEKQKMLLAQRTREVDLLKNDREYVAIKARDSLEMMVEGETIFRFDTKPEPDKSNMKLNR